MRLHSLADTERFAARLAAAVQACNPGALLFQGGLGAGKTTLVRFLIRALPGGAGAEPASPSFTICNIYCTAPLVHHFDLYRLPAGCRDEGLYESFDDPATLTIVEWAEHLAPDTVPADGLLCRLTPGGTEDGRTAALEALGPAGEHCLSFL